MYMDKPTDHEKRYVVIRGKKRAAYIIDGAVVTIDELAMAANCSRGAIQRRINSGMSPKEAGMKVVERKPNTIADRRSLMVERRSAAESRLILEGRYESFLGLYKLYRSREYGLSNRDAFYEALRLFPSPQ